MEFYAAVRRSVYVEGLSERAAARRFGLARETVRKMLRYRLPPGYRRAKPIRCPKLKPGSSIKFSPTISSARRNNGTRPSASGSAYASSTPSRAATRLSKTTCAGRSWAGKRCSCRSRIRRATPRPTSAKPWRFDRSPKNKKTSSEVWQSPQDPHAKVAKMKDGRTHLAHKAEHVVADKGYHSDTTLVALDEIGVRSYVMETRGVRRLTRSSPHCLSRPVQRIDFFHGLLGWGACRTGRGKEGMVQNETVRRDA